MNAYEKMVDRAADALSDGINPLILVLLLVVPTTVVYWSILTAFLGLGWMPATALGCLGLAVTLVLADRGISAFVKWMRDRRISQLGFTAI